MSQQQVTSEDHVRGNPDAPIVLVEYGDFQCPYCARAHAALTDLRAQHGDDLCLVWRHLPKSNLHPFAEAAAEAAEAAAAQDKFWDMHDALFAHQAELDPGALPQVADSVGLDGGRFGDDMKARRYRDRVQADAERGEREGATSTPSFFINGERYHGESDHASLAAAIQAALRGRDRQA